MSRFVYGHAFMLIFTFPPLVLLTLSHLAAPGLGTFSQSSRKVFVFFKKKKKERKLADFL